MADETKEPAAKPSVTPLLVTFNIRSLLMLVALIGALAPAISLVLQNRQDVRTNSVRLTKLETRLDAMELRQAEKEREWDRAKTIFCTSRMEDSVRSRNLPDIGC